MKTAYLLLVHEFPHNTKQLIRFLLTDPEAEVFIHIDRRTPASDFFIEDTRVHYLKRRYAICWGGFRMIRATMDLISEAGKSSPSYYCLLSGRDMVLHHPKLWNDRLERSYPRSFIKGGRIEDVWTKKGLDRVHYHFFYIFRSRKLAYVQNRAVRRIGHFLGVKRKMPYDLVPYCGSQWWCISDKHMQYIWKYLKTHPKYWNFYKTVGIPDEQFFHTILMNSSYSGELINESQTYVEWDHGFNVEFGAEDIPRLTGTGSAFVRKIKTDDRSFGNEMIKYILREEKNGQYNADGKM